MKIRTSLLAFIGALALAGCQSTTGPDQASAEGKTDKQRFIEADRVATECSAKSFATPSGQVVSQQIIFLSRDTATNEKLMASTSRLSGQQKLALREYLAENLKCREAFFAGLDGTAYYAVFARYFNTMDDVYVKLLTDQITIGQANAAKAKAIRDNAAEVSRFQ